MIKRLATTNKDERSYPIDRSHSEIVKFAPIDEVYDIVLPKLQGIAERAVSSAQTEPAESSVRDGKRTVTKRMSLKDYASRLPREVTQFIPMQKTGTSPVVR